MFRFVLIATMVAIAGLSHSASAQTADPQQPYANLQTRTIKALSDDQIADLEAGRGMGFALPAELNGYPGPRHVLELAEKLGLTQVQKDRTETLFASMKAEAVPLGNQLLSQEQTLDRLFAEKSADPINLSNAAAEIGKTQGKLRAAHLRYHLTMVELLTPHQMQTYARLRGYSDPSNGSKQDRGAHAH